MISMMTNNIYINFVKINCRQSFVKTNFHNVLRVHNSIMLATEIQYMHSSYK